MEMLFKMQYKESWPDLEIFFLLFLPECSSQHEHVHKGTMGLALQICPLLNSDSGVPPELLSRFLKEKSLEDKDFLSTGKHSLKSIPTEECQVRCYSEFAYTTNMYRRRPKRPGQLYMNRLCT